MKIKDIIKEYMGKEVKIGGKTGFFYCGIIDKNTQGMIKKISDKFLLYSSRQKNKIKAEIADLMKQKQNITDKEEIKRINIAIKKKKDSPDYLDALKSKDLMKCEVIDQYDSIMDKGVKIFIIDSTIKSTFYNRKSFENGMKKKTYRYMVE